MNEAPSLRQFLIEARLSHCTVSVIYSVKRFRESRVWARPAAAARARFTEPFDLIYDGNGNAEHHRHETKSVRSSPLKLGRKTRLGGGGGRD